MRLALEHLHLYLLDKGFITPASLVSGDYLATQVQTRNAIFRVKRQNAKSLFIKQLTAFEPNSTYVLQKDATCLWLIKNHPAFARLSDYVPDYIGFDPEKQVLVTEYLADASNLEEYARQHQGVFPERLRTELAAMLAAYHFPLDAELLAHRSVQFFSQQTPWVLNMVDNDPSTQQLLQNPSVRPVLEAVLGSPEFRQALAAVRHEWVATSLIHGDMKWMNLLLHPDEGAQKLKVIDWEFADIGDPLWDVAGIFQDLISSAVLYSPALANGASLLAGLNLAALREVWPLLEHFWLAYLAQTALGPALPDYDLAKALRYTAARLVQSAIERNLSLPTLQPVVIKLLQVSYAMLLGQEELAQYFATLQLATHA